MEIMDLDPCCLVIMNVSRRGGIEYERIDEHDKSAVDADKKVTEYTGQKTIFNEDEYNAANKLWGQCNHAFTKLGAPSAIGTVVKLDRIAEVEKLDTEWRAKMAEFNSTSTFTKLVYTCLVFKIEQNNASALERMVDELGYKLEELEKALVEMDPTNIRKVIQQFAGYTLVLPERVAEIVETAVNQAKAKANVISRTNKKIERLERKLKSVTDGQDPEEALAILNNLPMTRDMSKRVKGIVKLMEEKEEAVDKLAATKATIDAAPIRTARFAVMRKQQVGEDRSGELAGIQAGARLALV